MATMGVKGLKLILKNLEALKLYSMFDNKV